MKKNKIKLNIYQGKDRIFQAVPGAPGVSRFYAWDSTKNEYATLAMSSLTLTSGSSIPYRVWAFG
jgi:hypothetical protein